jgi:hypothetical protein
MGVGFLANAAEVQEFEEEWLQRRVLPSYGSRWLQRGKPPPEDLEQIVAEICQRAEAEAATINILGLGIAAEERDGMSWSAQKTLQIVQASAPGQAWDVRCVHGSASQRRELDELRELFGNSRPVRKAARATGFGAELRPQLGWWLTVRGLYLTGAVVTAAVTHLAANLGIGEAAGIGLAGAAAAAGGIKLAGSDQRITIGPAAEADQKIEAALRDQPSASIDERFRESLVAGLVPERPRVVIVDDYAALGTRTRDVIAGYLEGDGVRHKPELWIMFERAKRARASSGLRGREPFTARLLGALTPGKHISLWRGRQMALERPERETLIWKREHAQPRPNDPRLNRHAVAEVADKRGADWEAIRSEVLAAMADQPAAVQRAFGLLAIAAISPGVVDINSLAAAMSAPASGQKPIKRELLRDWFSSQTQSQADVEQALQAVKDRLGMLLDDMRPGTPAAKTRVTQPHADATRAAKTWGELGLPPQDLGHAFWALEALSKLGSKRNPLAGDQLVTHLRAIDDPGHLRHERGDETTDALFDATLTAVDIALALAIGGVTREVDTAERPSWDTQPGLLMQARRLLNAEEHRTHDRRSSALLATAWSSYMLLGDPLIVETLEKLSSELGHDGELEESEALLRLYREMLPQGDTSPLWPSSNQQAEPILDHARARAGMLALSLEPMILVDNDAELIATATAELTASAGPIARRAIGRAAQTDASAIRAVDLLTLSTLMLADAVATWRDPAADLGVRSALKGGSELGARRRTRGRGGAAMHVVADGLLRQLDATRRGCDAAREATRRGAESLAPDVAKQLDAALRDLDELEIMWRNLEYPELADHAAVAHNMVKVIGGGTARAKSEPRRSADYLLGVSEDRRAATHRATLEFLVSAARDGGRKEINPRAALPLIEGATTILGARLGEELTLSACLVAIRFGFKDELPKLERLLQHLLDPRRPRGVLDVPDERVFMQVTGLMNCFAGMKAVREIGLLDEILRRRDEIDSPWLADFVDQAIESFEAQSEPAAAPDEMYERAARWHDRVWGDGPPDAASSPAIAVAYRNQTQPTYAYYLAEIWMKLGATDLTADAKRLVEAGKHEQDKRNYVLLASRVVQGLDKARQERRLADSVATSDTGEGSSAVSSTTTGQISFSGNASSRASPAGEHEKLRALALELIREGVDRSAHTYHPLTAAKMYSQLGAQFMDNRSIYADKREYYRAQDERLNDERLLHERQQGHVFEIFWHHFDRIYELPLDRDRDDVFAELARETNDFLRDGPVFSEPLVFAPDGRPAAVSSAFISLGHHLLHSNADSDARLPAWEEPREQIQQHAKEQLLNFYWLLTERTPISQHLREVLRNRRERFEEQDE